MKAAIYNPYLDSLGGGERYTLAVATSLSDMGYKIDIEWKDPVIASALEKRFGISLSGINFIPDIKRGDGYDICFWISDGSIPLLKSRKNLLHFQIPFKDVSGDSLMNRMKMLRINRVVCNSRFTKQFIDREYRVNSLVLYPPVPVKELKPKRKENVILAVGRFSQLTQAKHQDILIEIFRELYDAGVKDWKLILAGGSEVGASDYIANLRTMTEGYPIRILESPNFTEIKNLYGTAKIFWSASGYGIDEMQEPNKVEHFGIAVVEAMSAGAVPMVIAAGGHKETVTDKVNGFLWQTKDELKEKTLKLIGSSPDMKKISGAAAKASLQYGYDNFSKELAKII